LIVLEYHRYFIRYTYSSSRFNHLFPSAVDHPEEIGDATWSEVCTACCVHDAEGWGKIFVGACVAIFFLYFFLVSLELLGSAAKVLGGCSAGGLMGDNVNPIAGLVIGELATALVQSSSTTTSIVVSLVGSGAIRVQDGIYMVMVRKFVTVEYILHSYYRY
jgi:sodium-dependent phosphate cotransporter